MQLEHVVTMCFFGYGGGQDELHSNKKSYHDRYMNLGRHPKLATYEEIDIFNSDTGPAKEVRTTTLIKPPNVETDRLGVYLIAHGNGGDSEPGAETLAQLMINALRQDQHLPVSKINIAVCQGASRLKVPTVKHSQNEFSNSMLKKFCAALLKSGVTMPRGMFVSAYSVNVETFDQNSTATQETLDKGYQFKEAPRDPTKIRTVQVDHKQKTYEPIHPDWGDSTFLANTVRGDALQAAWSLQRKNEGFVRGIKNAPGMDVNTVDLAVGIESFTELRQRYADFAANVEKRLASLVNMEIAKVMKGHGSAEFITKVGLYVRNKVAMKYDGQTFTPCSLSEYTDSTPSKEWLDIVTAHMMPKGMSPMGLTM